MAFADFFLHTIQQSVGANAAQLPNPATKQAGQQAPSKNQEQAKNPKSQKIPIFRPKTPGRFSTLALVFPGQKFLRSVVF